MSVSPRFWARNWRLSYVLWFFFFYIPFPLWWWSIISQCIVISLKWSSIVSWSFDWLKRPVWMSWSKRHKTIKSLHTSSPCGINRVSHLNNRIITRVLIYMSIGIVYGLYTLYACNVETEYHEDCVYFSPLLSIVIFGVFFLCSDSAFSYQECLNSIAIESLKNVCWRFPKGTNVCLV